MSILDQAIKASEAGLKVFPVKPGAKTPAISTWKTDATLDVATIKQWWAENPDYNIGLPAGRVNGLIVVDVDGQDAAWNWQAAGELRGDTVINTPNGRHYYYDYSAEQLERIEASGGKFDIHADGRYVVTQGSIVNGVEYVGFL